MITVAGVLRQEFDKDRGVCHYCDGRVFKAPWSWRRHLDHKHPGSTRQLALHMALTEAAWGNP